VVATDALATEEENVVYSETDKKNEVAKTNNPVNENLNLTDLQLEVSLSSNSGKPLSSKTAKSKTAKSKAAKGSKTLESVNSKRKRGGVRILKSRSISRR